MSNNSLIHTFTTKRLILRPWREADANSLFEYAKDPDVGPSAGWPPHKSPEESLRIIQNGLNGAECYAICEKESDIAIGCIELRLNGHTDMTDRDDECELGYWLGKPFWGRGYMPEAAKEILHHAFCDLGMTTVWCGYYDGNEKSKRVQEKLGFVYHHTCFDTPVPQMNEVRIGHTNVLTRENWLKNAMPRLEYISLRQRPKLLEQAAEWFHGKWGVPKEAYLECMDDYLGGKTEYGWYLCMDEGKIVGGLGVIENDFHDRKDLTPNICAVYTEADYRSKGIAGRLLNMAVEDLRGIGVSPVYLLTDHTGFYERYGWEFLCMVQGDGETELSRMYIHR